MPISLYAAVVPSWIQILEAARLWLVAAESAGLSDREIVDARLIEDMLPLSYQVKSMVVHSVGAIEGVRAGVFSPDASPLPGSVGALRERLADARTELERIEELEVDAFIGRAMRFQSDRHSVEFRAEDFLLSFSQPNFFFHATTAYDLLRMQGVSIGKADFLGSPRARGVETQETGDP